MISIAPDYQTPRRMAAKLQAVPLPELRAKRVLDVGCDAGAWCWLAAEQGAADVLGLDRGREVRGRGFVDVIKENRRCAAHEGRERCRFERIEIGKQYHFFGHFDVVFCLSVYHHLFEAAGGDHVPIWLWLWFHARLSRAVLLWEGPVDTSDPVVRANVSAEHHHAYTRAAILAAASKFFEPEYIGPALHEPTREVWRFRPRAVDSSSIGAEMKSGAGGATRAFQYAGGRRMDEIERVLGSRPVPGSLNLRLDGPFDWDAEYFRAQILDVKDRSRGIESEWGPRWARFYPVKVDDEDACAFRFESEHYDLQFMELIAPRKLRDMVHGPAVRVERC